LSNIAEYSDKHPTKRKYQKEYDKKHREKKMKQELEPHGKALFNLIQ